MVVALSLFYVMLSCFRRTSYYSRRIFYSLFGICILLLKSCTIFGDIPYHEHGTMSRYVFPMSYLSELSMDVGLIYKQETITMVLLLLYISRLFT